MSVHNELGSGFPEVIYQRGLGVELTAANVLFQAEIHLLVYYKGTAIGSRWADFLVDNQVLVESKVTSELTSPNYAQVINYLKAHRLEVALLINFSESSLRFKRFLHNASRPLIKLQLS